MIPRFSLSADGKPITDRVNPILVSLSVTDETGTQADRLSIELDDSTGTLELPKKGAVLALQLGMEIGVGLGLRMIDCGEFTVDTVSGSGPPDILRIEARAAPMAGTGKIQQRKSRSWDGKKLGDIVNTIANENDLAPIIAKNLADVDPGHLDQTDESDISFLARLARDFGGAVKAAAGRLAFIERGASRTASGGKLPSVTLTRLGKSSYSWTFADRGSYKSIVASYRDIEAATTIEVLVGEGDPAFRLPHTYSSESNARRAARARLDDFKRTSGGTVQVTQEARLDVIAESPVVLVGYRQGVNGEYVARRVTHTLSKSGALTTSIDCEKGISEG